MGSRFTRGTHFIERSNNPFCRNWIFINTECHWGRDVPDVATCLKRLRQETLFATNSKIIFFAEMTEVRIGSKLPNEARLSIYSSLMT